MEVSYPPTKPLVLLVSLLILSVGSVLVGQDLEVPFHELGTLPTSETLREKQAKALAEQAVEHLAPQTANGSVHVVRVTSEDRPEIYLEYDLGWIRFIDRLRVRQPIDILAKDAQDRVRSELDRRVPAKPLLRPVISKERATEALQTCHSLLQANVIPPRPPYFTNQTNIVWRAEQDYLALRSDAVVDRQNNHCARAFVDLRTVAVKCFPVVACEVYR